MRGFAVEMRCSCRPERCVRPYYGSTTGLASVPCTAIRGDHQRRLVAAKSTMTLLNHRQTAETGVDRGCSSFVAQLVANQLAYAGL